MKELKINSQAETNLIDSKKSRNAGIDFLRFICALMVVCIHIGFPGHLGQAMILVSRIAVPCFFIISGYFFNSKKFNLRKTTLKLLMIALIGHILYAVKCIALTPENIATTFSLKNLGLFVVFNHPVWAEHLWYLSAMIYTYVIIVIVEKLKIVKVLYFAIPALLIINLALGEFSGVIFGHTLPAYFGRNFLFFALPFFLIGRLIREKGIAVKKVKGKILCIGIGAFGLLISLVEYAITRAKVDFFIGLLFMSVSVFLIFAEGLHMPKWTTCIAYAGHEYTLFIYVAHSLVGLLLQKIAHELAFSIYPYIATIAVFVVTLLCAILFKQIIKYLDLKIR